MSREPNDLDRLARAQFRAVADERFRLDARLMALNPQWTERVEPDAMPGGPSPDVFKGAHAELERGNPDVLGVLHAHVDALTEQAVTLVNALVSPAERRRAVIARPSLAWRMPWLMGGACRPDPSVPGAFVLHMVIIGGFTHGVTEEIAATIPAAAGHVVPVRHVSPYQPLLFLPWPTRGLEERDITREAVTDALRRSTSRDARRAAKVITEAAAPILARGQAPNSSSRLDDMECDLAETDALRAEGLLMWHPRGVAAVLHAWREADAEHSRRAPFAFPASSESSAVVSHISAAASVRHSVTTVESRALQPDRVERAIIRVKVGDRFIPYQMEIPFDGEGGISQYALGVLMDQFRDDGPRDYVTLFDMADAHGRTGRTPWTLDEHMRIAGYSDRIARGDRFVDVDGRTVRATKEAVHRAIVRRLRMFTRIALYKETDGVMSKTPIGGGPILRGVTDVSAELFTVALFEFNAVIYAGARSGSGRMFTMIPRGVLPQLHGGEVSLLAHRCIEERREIARGGRTTVDEHTLFRRAGISPDGKHIGKKRALLRRYQANVNAALGDGATVAERETGRGRDHDTTPAGWKYAHEALRSWPDGATPRPLDVPQTCGALRAWRERAQLSQTRCAELLVVPVRTLKYAETRGLASPDAPLPPPFRSASWLSIAGAARSREMPSPVEVRALPSGRRGR